jgi:MYXO-CTERM domain-containing protein
MLLQLLSVAVAANPVPHDHSLSASQSTESLYTEFVQFFDPGSLPVAERLSPETWHCGTGLLLAIRNQWTSFTPAQQSRMALIARPPVPESDSGQAAAPVAPPAGVPTQTCFDQYPELRPQWAGDGENRIVTEHFSVEWDGGSISQTNAQDWADSLEHSWDVEFDEMGWKEPIGTDTYLVLAFVADFDYAGAVTSMAYCGGNDTAFIIAGKASFGRGNWHQDMAGHELNHASQFTYGQGHEFYFWEATATWIVEYLYPTHNMWSQYIMGYTTAPYLAINKSSQEDQTIAMHMYGMAVLNFYLDEYVGGPELIRELWEYSETHGWNYDLWMGEAMSGLGYDWSEVYDGFIATNSVMDYADQEYFPTVDVSDTVKEFPASGGKSGNKKPEGYGQNYVRIKTTNSGEDSPDLALVFEGDNKVEWSVQLVGEVEGVVGEVHKVDVVEGLGEATVLNFGTFDNVWMVVSPLTTKSKAYSYTWELDTFNSNPEPVDTGDGGATTEEVGGCACSATPAHGKRTWFPAALLVLLPWVRRRRAK